ncbi:bifunctional MFS transporter/dTMP kinase [Tamaricihabitans halophyticus]|uniref:bifunctional MFS transporter/dTMP kinase n=1 Tax=Tamaricihabitans halophyticus TaxID=1262583 RepID=UPI00104C7633|nr:MFS transporter [Tamaricihabitans halophyticus]
MGAVDSSKQAGTSASSDASTARRIRAVLSIRPFRRLWGTTYLCSAADWLSFLALTGLTTKLTDSYAMQNFAFSGVVLTQLLPGLLFAPLGGLLADRFDRRKVMALCDVLRCSLLLSIPIVDEAFWIFIANALVGCCAAMWIPCKDSAVPNLLRRKEQVETANQLGLVMTYGISVITAAGLYAVVTGVGPMLHLPENLLGELVFAKIIVVFNGLLYLVSALLVLTRIPELSRRDTGVQVDTSERESAGPARADEQKLGLFGMIRDAGRFVRSTPLVRGLLIGMIGAFAAGGAVVGSAKPYSSSLLGGDSTFGLLFVALFIGLGAGMVGAPKLARRLPHSRLFGISIVIAGIALILVALSPHLAVALITVSLVGGCAGVAFLTGVTIIGTQIEDAIRGRINAIYQSLMKLILAGTIAVTPLLIGLVRPRMIEVFGRVIVIDGTRPVMLGGGLIAALVGVIAYRQMGDRSPTPIISDLLNAIRGKRIRSAGLLISIEGSGSTDTATQAGRLAEWLRGGNREVLLAAEPGLDDARLREVLDTVSISGARARALVAAAVRAEVVERDVRPALDAGAIVVMDRFMDSPLAHHATTAGLDPAEVEGLTDWATARLRPDVTVLLDSETNTQDGQYAGPQLRVQSLLSDMAAADPDRYAVVYADGSADDVASRVRGAVHAMLAVRDPKLGLGSDGSTQPPAAGADPVRAGAAGVDAEKE